jgi:hypothetical protein
MASRPHRAQECTAHLIKINVVDTDPKLAELHFDWGAILSMDAAVSRALPLDVQDFLQNDAVLAFLDQPDARERLAQHDRFEGSEEDQSSPPVMHLSPQRVSELGRVDQGNESIRALAGVVDHIAVEVPAARSGAADSPPYVIIDAPGLGAGEQRRAIAERHLLKCHVPIVVASFIDLSLEPLREALLQIKDSGHEPIVVVTKLDEQYSRLRRDNPRGADVPALMEQCKRDARKRFVDAGCAENDVHFVSAYWYEDSREGSSWLDVCRAL